MFSILSLFLSVSFSLHTYEYKSIEFQGVQHNYIMYNLEFNDDLYYVENWPCPCINNTIVNNYYPRADETGFNVTILTKGISVEQIIDEEIVFFAFEVETDGIVKIYIPNHWGEVNGYISKGKIPFPNSYELTKYAKTRDSLWVCPTERWYGKGWWYVSVSRNEPYDNNHFSIWWDTIPAVTCNQEKIVNVVDNRIVLQNDIGYENKARYFQYTYFEYHVYQKCTNFSFCVKQTTDDFGDIDVYMSLVDKYPDIDSHQYASQNNGNDGITVVELCSTDDYWSIYIGIYSWQGDHVPYIITATNSSTFEFRLIRDVSPQQFLYTFANGQATLECSTEDIRCEFYSYEGCLDPYDIWYCCARFGFLPPHDDVNPWIVNQPAVTVGRYKSLPFQSYPSVADNVRGKLTLFQYLSSVSLLDGRVFTTSNCTIRFNNMITDSSFKPIESIKPVKANYECDSDNLEDVGIKIDSLIQKIAAETDIQTLKLYDIQLSDLSNRKAVQGCKDKLYSVTSRIISNLTWNNHYCSNNYSDPCCSWNMTLWDACYSHDIVVSRELISRAETNSVCLNKTINNYIEKQDILQCLDRWQKAVKGVSTSFVYSCAVKLFGTFEFLGKPCDNICQCNLTTGICIYSIDDYISCVWNEMNEIVPIALVNYWQINSEITKDVFAQEFFSRYVRPMCTGPGSSGFRSRYTYLLTLPSCVDDCVRNNVTVQCYTTDSIACPKNKVCPPGSSTNCYRSFQFFTGDDQQCEQATYCNADHHKCLNNEYACLDCTDMARNNGSCIYLPDRNETECTEIIVTNGHCSDGNSLCLADVYCSGLNELRDYIFPLTVACFGQFETDFYGDALCSGDYADNPWGCLNSGCDRYFSVSDCNQTYACYTGKIFNYMSRNDCEYSGYLWQPMFKWEKTEWIPAVTKPLIWTRAEYKPIRTIKETIDYVTFYSDVVQASNNIVSLKYRENAACRTESLLNTLKSIAGIDQYSARLTVAEDWACRGKNNTVGDYLTLTVDSFCSVVTVSKTPANLYQVDPNPRLSSQLFTNHVPNSWSVIYSHSFLVQGQIVTDAMTVEFSSSLSLTSAVLCINVTVEEQSLLFDLYGIGVIEDNKIVLTDMIVDNAVCVNITSPGTYIGVKYRNTDEIYTSLLAQSVTASVLYFLLLAGVIFQIVNIVFTRPTRYYLKLTFGFVTALFLITRGIYFILYITGVINNHTVYSYIFFEFSTYLFLIMNSAIIFIWFEIAYHTKNVHKSSTFSNIMFTSWVGWNIIILIVFAGFIIAYYASSDTSSLPCSLLYFQLSESQTIIDVSRGYTIFVAVVCFIMCAGFLISGIIFVYQVHTISKNNKTINMMVIKTWLTLSVFCVCFTVKSILILVAEFSVLIVPIIVFALLEQIPTAVLMYYLRPPVADEVKSLVTSPTGSSSSKRKTSSVSPPASTN